jgi:hypothetical protein
MQSFISKGGPRNGARPGLPMEISAQRKVYMVKGGQIDFFLVKMHTSLMGLSSQAPGRGPTCPGSGSAPVYKCVDSKLYVKIMLHADFERNRYVMQETCFKA